MSAIFKATAMNKMIGNTLYAIFKPNIIPIIHINFVTSSNLKNTQR